MASSSHPQDTLEQAVTELSVATSQLLRRVRSEAGADDLGWSQLAVIARLGEGGPQTTAELARSESMTPQSMGALLVQMEQRKLVERRPHPSDGRQILIALTAAGAEARRQRGMAKRAWLLAAMAKLTPAEQDALIGATALIRRLAES